MPVSSHSPAQSESAYAQSLMDAALRSARQSAHRAKDSHSYKEELPDLVSAILDEARLQAGAQPVNPYRVSERGDFTLALDREEHALLYNAYGAAFPCTGGNSLLVQSGVARDTEEMCALHKAYEGAKVEVYDDFRHGDAAHVLLARVNGHEVNPATKLPYYMILTYNPLRDAPGMIADDAREGEFKPRIDEATLLRLYAERKASRALREAACESLAAVNPVARHVPYLEKKKPLRVVQTEAAAPAPVPV